MRANGTASLVLAAAAVGICATLAGCASGTQAARITPAQRVQNQRQGQLTRPPQGSAANTVARTGRPSAKTRPAAAPAPASHSPAVRQKVAAMLTSGLYTDGPDGTPHYDLSFTSGPGSILRGSVSFLYQDGRVSTVGSYAGTLSRSGKITLTLGDGKALSGRYTAGHLTLSGCAAALPLATFAGGCAFTYHGHVP